MSSADPDGAVLVEVQHLDDACARDPFSASQCCLPRPWSACASWIPAIGAVPQVSGFILAADFSGHGFGIGPGAGHLIADLVTGAPTSPITRLSSCKSC